jgi:hypothetical protein
MAWNIEKTARYGANMTEWQPIETAPMDKTVWVKSKFLGVPPFKAVYIKDREVTKTNHVIVRDKWQCVDKPDAFVQVSTTNSWSTELPQ